MVLRYYGLKKKKKLEGIKQILQDLIKAYKSEIVQAQLLNKICKQLTIDGLLSLDIDQLNILLDNQCKFINGEIEYYRKINEKLIILGRWELNKDSENQQYLIISKKLRRINDFLDFQAYSTNGEQFIIVGEKIMNSSFLSKNDSYFATIDMYAMVDYYERLEEDYDIYLNIRKQNSLDVIQKLILKTAVQNLKFDSLFNYCIIQYVDELTNMYFYILRNNKQLKMIKKFQQESLIDFLLSNQNNMIIFLEDQIIIKALNFKNKLINNIKFSYNQGNYCYGSERNIIAINHLDLGQIQIYLETQKDPFIRSYVSQEFSDLMFINYDSQLLTLDEENLRLWQIDYHTLKINLIHTKELLNSLDYNFQNKTEFNIIKQTFDDDGSEIKILDQNFNSWFKFEVSGYFQFQFNYIKLTKNFLILCQDYESSIIKRRSINDYERLENDFEILE